MYDGSYPCLLFSRHPGRRLAGLAADRRFCTAAVYLPGELVP